MKPNNPLAALAKGKAASPTARRPVAKPLPRSEPKPSRSNGDFALGAVGCCLAVASAAFGIGMTVHGPVGSLGSSKEFTVFAQLAPHSPAAADPSTGSRLEEAAKPRPERATDAADLDMTATASVPKPGEAPVAGAEAAIIPTVTLEALSEDAATVAIQGRTEIVHVGDILPGAGTVLAILPGAKPALKTTRGLIVPAIE